MTFSHSKFSPAQIILAGNNYLNSPHSQGGMKFATQISPLLNFPEWVPDAETHQGQQRQHRGQLLSNHQHDVPRGNYTISSAYHA